MYTYLTKRLKKKNRGFTLIEVIVVIGILAILSALAIPAVGGYIENSKATTNVSNAKMLYNASSAYIASNPNKTAADVAGDNVLVLKTDKYLATIPKTAAAAEYTVVNTDGVLTITWTKETANATEGGSAIAKLATAIYPF